MGKYRACVYVRVSTDEQASEGFSLAAQEERCKNFIQSQGWDLVKEPYVDDGYSAKDLERPAIQQLIHDLKNNEFDVIVVYRLDRLVRSVLDLHHLLQLFDKHKVAFKSVTEVFDTTTAMGRFFITLVAAMAQWERENLAERVIMGQERRFLEGKRNGAIAPYGYRLENEKLVIDPEEAKIVKRIFEMYLKHGMLTIAKQLNESGYRTRNGSLWTTYTIKFILQNPVYTGKLRWNYRDVSGKKKDLDKVVIVNGDHEPIVSQELFDEVQQSIKVRHLSTSAKAQTSDFPFSGVLVCGRCGSRMVGSTIRRKRKKGYIHYQYNCTQKTHRGACDMPSISEIAVEEAFLKSLQWFADASDFEPPEPEKDTRRERREEIEKEIERIRKRRKKLLREFADDEATAEDIRELINEDREREKELLEELKELPDEDTTWIMKGEL
jgi:site-specific DNA recombinase